MNRVDLEDRLKDGYDRNLSDCFGNLKGSSTKWVNLTLDSCNWTFEKINKVPKTFVSHLEKLLDFFEQVINKLNDEETKAEIEFALQMFIRLGFNRNLDSIRSLEMSLIKPRKQIMNGRPNIYVSDRYERIIDSFYKDLESF